MHSAVDSVDYSECLCLVNTRGGRLKSVKGAKLHNVQCPEIPVIVHWSRPAAQDDHTVTGSARGVVQNASCLGSSRLVATYAPEVNPACTKCGVDSHTVVDPNGTRWASWYCPILHGLRLRGHHVPGYVQLRLDLAAPGTEIERNTRRACYCRPEIGRPCVEIFNGCVNLDITAKI